MKPAEFESAARERAQTFFGVSLPKDNIPYPQGGKKSFDMVNQDAGIAGDAKRNSPTTRNASGVMATLCQYVWLLQHLPPGYFRFLVIGPDETFAQKFVDQYHWWLDDVKVFFFDGGSDWRLLVPTE